MSVSRRRWLELADSIVDGYDPATGIYEQFAGFNALEPLLIAELAPRLPVAADMLLGHERTQATQVVKQADVLMLHYLIPDEVAAGSLQSNLDFYGPRTAHGSTLSPGVHAALLARAGRLAEALEMLRLAARIDLDDIGHMTAGGFTLPRWAASGAHSRLASPACDRWATRSRSTRCSRPGGTRSSCGCASATVASASASARDAVEASADPPVSALNPAGERVELDRTPQTFRLSPPSPRRTR